jgi:hypothetical protein
MPKLSTSKPFIPNDLIEGYIKLMIKYPCGDYDRRLVSLVWTIALGSTTINRNVHILEVL